jgi:hypothetical protein
MPFIKKGGDMKKPDWFILIEQWKKKGMGERGVTLPFIVGALAHKRGEGDLGAQHVRNVLEDIRKHPVEGHVTHITWCHDRAAPLLEVMRIEDALKTSVTIPRPSGEGDSIVFGRLLYDRWKSKDPDDLLRQLEDDATEPVSKGHYSRKKIWKEDHFETEYGDFEAKELDYIQSTIMTS